MKSVALVMLMAMGLSACTVTADVPNRVTIDADKVTFHRDDDYRHHDHKYKDKYHKQKHCPYGQAKKGRC